MCTARMVTEPRQKPVLTWTDPPQTQTQTEIPLDADRTPWTQMEPPCEQTNIYENIISLKLRFRAVTIELPSSTTV